MFMSNYVKCCHEKVQQRQMRTKIACGGHKDTVTHISDKNRSAICLHLLLDGHDDRADCTTKTRSKRFIIAALFMYIFLSDFARIKFYCNKQCRIVKHCPVPKTLVSVAQYLDYFHGSNGSHLVGGWDSSVSPPRSGAPSASLPLPPFLWPELWLPPAPVSEIKLLLEPPVWKHTQTSIEHWTSAK